MTFSEEAWKSVAPWFDAIMAHPFVMSLSDGTLPEAMFTRYLLDDAHFLIGYARALAALATRTTTPGGGAMLARAAANAVEAERQLHVGFLAPRGIDSEASDAAEPSPTCRGYTGTLQADAMFAPLEVGMAGILPCFRVYAEVGRSLLATDPAPTHPFLQWIETYSDPDFDQAVKEAEAYTDELAREASEHRVAQMRIAYHRATRFEWMFWDAAWRDERWPVPDPERQSDEDRQSHRLRE